MHLCSNTSRKYLLANYNVFNHQVVTDTMFAELKECFMEAYDDNRDGNLKMV